MPVNPKAVRALNKVLDAGFTEEKAIAAMTMDDILSMQGITVADITLIMLSGIFLLPVATQSHQIKISMNRKQI